MGRKCDQNKGETKCDCDPTLPAISTDCQRAGGHKVEAKCDQKGITKYYLARDQHHNGGDDRLPAREEELRADLHAHGHEEQPQQQPLVGRNVRLHLRGENVGFMFVSLLFFVDLFLLLFLVMSDSSCGVGWVICVRMLDVWGLGNAEFSGCQGFVGLLACRLRVRGPIRARCFVAPAATRCRRLRHLGACTANPHTNSIQLNKKTHTN